MYRWRVDNEQEREREMEQEAGKARERDRKHEALEFFYPMVELLHLCEGASHWLPGVLLIFMCGCAIDALHSQCHRIAAFRKFLVSVVAWCWKLSMCHFQCCCCCRGYLCLCLCMWSCLCSVLVALASSSSSSSLSSLLSLQDCCLSRNVQR